MNGTIKIYITDWHDITEIKGFLNSYLIKYRVYRIYDNVFADPTNELPIIEINGTFLYNPTLAELRDVLGLKKIEPVAFHDVVIVGANIESFFFLDYALRMGIDAIALMDNGNIKQFRHVYEKILRVPNPFIDGYIYPSRVTHIQMLQSRRHLEITTKTNEKFFARSSFIVLDSKQGYFNVENERKFLNESIFVTREDVIKKVKEKRIRNKRKRVFAVIGDHLDILHTANELHKELSMLHELMEFEVIVVSDINFRHADKFLLRILRTDKQMRIFGQVHIKGFSEKGYRTLIQTDLIDYPVDYILMDKKKAVANEFLHGFCEVDDNGLLETDATGKTTFMNVYAMQKKEFHLKDDIRTDLLKTYVACADVAQRMQVYLEGH